MAVLFPALFDKPAKISFYEQEADEKIELLLRQHWITNIPWIFIAAFLVFIPILFLRMFELSGINFLNQIPGNIFSAGLILWYLGILAYVVDRFLHWYFNIYIVTNKHLVDINFHNLTNRDITEIGIGDVQSVSSRITGIIRSFFHFGDVIVETAAKMQDVEFEDVPKPDFVADRIQDLQEAFENRKNHPNGGPTD